LPISAKEGSRTLKACATGSLIRTLKKSNFKVTFNTAFAQVMKGCANRPETWITEEFLDAYTHLHQLNFAHSVEVWRDQNLVGGLYGLSISGAFFAESKFHKETDASKVALYHLVQHLNEKGFTLLEVQFLNPHLKRLGAIEVPNTEYQKRLTQALKLPTKF